MSQDRNTNTEEVETEGPTPLKTDGSGEKEGLEEISDELEEDSDEESRKPPKLGELYFIISNSRRRMVIRYMDDSSREQPFELGDIAEEIAATELDKDVSSLDSQQRKNVYIPLYQNHLIKLDEFGAVNFDDERKIVNFPDQKDRFNYLLHFVSDCSETQRATQTYFENLTDNLVEEYR